MSLLVKPPLWDFNRHAVKVSARWPWQRSLVCSFPLWRWNELTTNSGLLNLATGETIPISALISAAPTWETSDRGSVLRFDNTANPGLALGTTSMGLDMTNPWSIEALVHLDSYGGSGNDRFPSVMQFAAGDQIEAGSAFTIFFGNPNANYDGINVGWPSGPKGDTIGAGLDGADLDGVWTHFVLRYLGGGTGTLANYDVRVYTFDDAGATVQLPATFTFADNGAYSGSSAVNRLGTSASQADWNGTQSFMNIYNEALSDPDCDRRFADPFGMFVRDDPVVATVAVAAAYLPPDMAHQPHHQPIMAH